MNKGTIHLGNSLGAIKLVGRKDSNMNESRYTGKYRNERNRFDPYHISHQKCNKSASSKKVRPIEKDYQKLEH